MRVLSGKSTSGDVLAAAFDNLRHEIVVLDSTGRIIIVNEPFLRFGRENGWNNPEACIGTPYLQQCLVAAQAGDRTSGRIATALAGLLMGQRDGYATVYQCDSPWQARWFRLTMTAWIRDGQRGVIMVHENATADIQVERAVARAARHWVASDDTQYSVRLQERLDALAMRVEALTSQAFSVDGAADLAVVTAPDALLTALARLLLDSAGRPGGNVLLSVAAREKDVVLLVIGLQHADPASLQALREVPGFCEVHASQSQRGAEVAIVLRKASHYEA